MKLKLKELLEKRKITQSQLAKDLGVTNAIVSLWCSNKVIPHFKRLDEIANYLKVDVKKLFQ